MKPGDKKQRFISGLRDGTTGLIYLRFVELVAFFAIVFIARLLGKFEYHATALLSLFLVGCLLQYNAAKMWQFVGHRMGWSADQRNYARRVYTSVVDVALIVALIYLTGTIESPFLLLLTVPIFFAGNLLSWKTTVRYLLAGAIAAVTVLSLLEMAGTIPHFTCYRSESGVFLNRHYVAGSLLVISAFISLVVFLSQAFQERVARTLESLRRSGEESRERIDELSHLYDISLGINSAISIDTLLKIVAKEVTLLVNRPWAAIVLINDKQEITHAVFVGVNQDQAVQLGRRLRHGGLSEWIWTHRAPIIVKDIEKDKRANCSDFLHHFGIRSIVGFPLMTGKHVTGAVYTGQFKAGGMDKRRVELLTSLSSQLSTAIDKSSLHESLERHIRDLETQMGALEKTNALKSDFVTHVSHELKTPLTSIKAYVETLASNIADPNFTQGEEFLAIVRSETDRLIRIVNDILDVSRIEFGQRPLKRTSVRLQRVVDDVSQMLKPAMDERNVELVIDIPEDIPRLDADADLVKQVFINLISNALKYSPEGTSINICARAEAVNVSVSIEDHGIGIPDGAVGDVFTKFFQVHSPDARVEGVGLGLAIVKNIIEQHGGTIDVVSHEGEGTGFTFNLPREHCFNDLIGYIAEVVDARDQLHEMIELIVKMIAELLQARIVSLMLLDKTRSELFIKMSYGLDQWVVDHTRVKMGEGIAGRVAESGVPLLIDNIEENEVYSCPNNPQYDTMSLLSVPLVVNDVIVGVINVNNKTDGCAFAQDDLNLLSSFSERISRALERVRIVEDSRAYLEDTIEAFRRMLDTHSRTKIIESAVNLAAKVARRLGLEEKEVSVVQYVASVHDIGMTEISTDILNTTLRLTDKERAEIEKHPQRGAELIRPLEFIESVSNIILYHHERVDGKGYPMGLHGEQIPIGARVLAVIDAFQSMTLGRPYRERVSVEDAVQELVDCSGRQFDEGVVDAFVWVLREEGRLSIGQEREFRSLIKEARTIAPSA